ncbi:hypothetical protein HanXRQr2_Chr06g0261201 [Helianthus annuus]|uniref:Secreted protein n=1 Tax=Helianthus annuus TaxID=4232 RepID=A0A9K3IV27_HELAN|nr:hypothetical protein HanXRQr2_Chr06g0261201 [Helianthus annuus]
MLLVLVVMLVVVVVEEEDMAVAGARNMFKEDIVDVFRFGLSGVMRMKGLEYMEIIQLVCDTTVPQVSYPKVFFFFFFVCIKRCGN